MLLFSFFSFGNGWVRKALEGINRACNGHFALEADQSSSGCRTCPKASASKAYDAIRPVKIFPPRSTMNVILLICVTVSALRGLVDPLRSWALGHQADDTERPASYSRPNISSRRLNTGISWRRIRKPQKRGHAKVNRTWRFKAFPPICLLGLGTYVYYTIAVFYGKKAHWYISCSCKDGMW